MLVEQGYKHSSYFLPKKITALPICSLLLSGRLVVLERQSLWNLYARSEIVTCRAGVGCKTCISVSRQMRATDCACVDAVSSSRQMVSIVNTCDDQP